LGACVSVTLTPTGRLQTTATVARWARRRAWSSGC
jgi:hypothetical protein